MLQLQASVQMGNGVVGAFYFIKTIKPLPFFRASFMLTGTAKLPNFNMQRLTWECDACSETSAVPVSVWLIVAIPPYSDEAVAFELKSQPSPVVRPMFFKVAFFH